MSSRSSRWRERLGGDILAAILISTPDNADEDGKTDLDSFRNLLAESVLLLRDAAKGNMNQAELVRRARKFAGVLLKHCPLQERVLRGSEGASPD